MSLGTTNLRYATEYQIDYINLMSNLQGGVINLIEFLVELNIFEDIYSPTITGKIVVSDALGFIGNFRLNGTEFVQIGFRKSASSENAIVRNFRVFSITNRNTNQNNAYESYVIEICSEEFIFSEQYRISKGYTNTAISDIITDILTKYIKVGGNVTTKNSTNIGTKNIYIEKTKGAYDFALPNKKLFETINWLSNYAMPLNQFGADMLFYENCNGYFFQSLQTLYQQNTYQTFYYNPKNISTEVKDQVVNVIDFEVLNFFDTLDAVNNGFFANKTISFDVLTRTKKTNNFFSYDNYYGKSKHLNKYPVTNDYKNRRNDYIHQVMDGGELEMGVLRLASSNQKQKMNSWVMNSKNGADNVANDIFIETYMKNRVAQLGLINYTRLKITVPGDQQLAIGSVVKFITYGVGGTNEHSERKPDPFYSGRYLITAVRHKLDKDLKYITVLEISKESTDTQYSGFDNSNPILKSLVNGIQ
jgi:hypothetical protein